jgi:hypothetical protein
VHGGDAGAFDPADIAALSDPARSFPDGAVPPTGVADEAALAAARADAEAAGLPALMAGWPWEEWLRGVGLPPSSNAYDATERAAVDALADAWLDAPADAAARTPGATAGWKARHWIALCERLLERSAAAPGAISAAALRAVDGGLRLSSSSNSEVKAAWAVLGVRAGLAEALPAAEALLRSAGRMKYVRPVMRELLRSPAGRPLALRVFEAHGRASYHPVCAKMVAVDIEKECAKAPALPQLDDGAGAGAASGGAGSAVS